MKAKLLVVAAVASAILSFISAANATASFSLTELNPLGATTIHDTSIAWGINDAGQVVGYGTTGIANAGYQATTWTGTTPTALGPLPLGGHSFALAINDSGQISGGENLTGFGANPVMWNGSTTPITLSNPSGLITGLGSGINNAGQIVGSAGNTDTHAIIWNSGTPTDLSALNGNAGAANAINNLGQVAGLSYPNGISGLAHATIWNGTTPTDLGTLGAQTSVAASINDSGVVVGQSAVNQHGPGLAFVWDGGPMTALPLLAGAAGSGAYDVNNFGSIVGHSDIVGESTAHATLWDNGIAIDLNTVLSSSGIGWVLADALGINSVGQIVGYGINPEGKQHAYLLTPCNTCTVVDTLPQSPFEVPLPPSAALFASVLGALGLLRRWRKRKA
jgi:probable HAF family extracellular repeat protein